MQKLYAHERIVRHRATDVSDEYYQAYSYSIKGWREFQIQLTSDFKVSYRRNSHKTVSSSTRAFTVARNRPKSHNCISSCTEPSKLAENCLQVHMSIFSHTNLTKLASNCFQLFRGCRDYFLYILHLL